MALISFRKEEGGNIFWLSGLFWLSTSSQKSLDKVSVWNTVHMSNISKYRNRFVADDVSVMKFWHNIKNRLPNFLAMSAIHATLVSLAPNERTFQLSGSLWTIIRPRVIIQLLKISSLVEFCVMKTLSTTSCKFEDSLVWNPHFLWRNMVLIKIAVAFL